MIKRLLWDFNGVVLADARYGFEADAVVIDFLGGHLKSLADLRRTLTTPVIDFFVANGCDRDVCVARSGEAVDLFIREYETRAAHSRTRVGVRETLRFLQSREIRSAIFSYHRNSAVEGHLRRLRLTKLFEDVTANVDPTAVHHRRAKKEWIEEYLTKIPEKPGEVLIIGDSVEEVEIGKALGLVNVAITGGWIDSNLLRKARPDHLIHRVSQLIDIIGE